MPLMKEIRDIIKPIVDIKFDRLNRQEVAELYENYFDFGVERIPGKIEGQARYPAEKY